MTQVFHSAVNNVVPWQANYTFPSQATKVQKQTVKLPPKNGMTFVDSNVIRIEFPSDMYLNALNSLLLFDVVLTANRPTVELTGTFGVGTTSQKLLFDITAGNIATDGYFEGYILYDPATRREYLVDTHTSAQLLIAGANNIDVPFLGSTKLIAYPGHRLQKGGGHQLFKRLKIIYGGMPLEDIQEYARLSRFLLEVGCSESVLGTGGAILDGTYGSIENNAEHNRSLLELGSARRGGLAESYIRNTTTSGTTSTTTRSFALNLFSGLMASKKLIPLKWMSAQFVIELTLAPGAECLLQNNTDHTVSYQVQNVNYLAELLEFDAMYDAGFFMGLKDHVDPETGVPQKGGVPLKFSSWHHHTFPIAGATQVCQIHERSRSIKSAFAMVCNQQASVMYDHHQFFYDAARKYITNTSADATAYSASQTEYKVDATKFALHDTTDLQAPIEEFQWRIGGKYHPAQPVLCTKGAPEAYIELLKAVDALGDYTYQNTITPRTWAVSLPANALSSLRKNQTNDGSKFIMACEFEHSDVYPDTISGINAEEQSDLQLTIKLGGTGGGLGSSLSKRVDVFVQYDSLIIIRDMNIVDLVM